MRPHVVEVISAVGLSKDGLFKTFLASKRRSKLTRSVILNFFRSDASHWKYFGAIKKLRPVLPIDPGAGAVNSARVAELNQKFLPLSKVSSPMSREQLEQSAVAWTTLLTVFTPE